MGLLFDDSGSLGDGFGMILRSFWDHFGIVPGSCWDRFGLFWDHLGINLDFLLEFGPRAQTPI